MESWGFRFGRTAYCTMKLSGFGMFNTQWSASSVEPLLLHCIQSFGPSRMMFGSNFPVDKLMASYTDVVSRISAAISAAAAHESLPVDATLNEVFCETAQRVYRLQLDSKR